MSVSVNTCYYVTCDSHLSQYMSVSVNTCYYVTCDHYMHQQQISQFVEVVDWLVQRYFHSYHHYFHFYYIPIITNHLSNYEKYYKICCHWFIATHKAYFHHHCFPFYYIPIITYHLNNYEKYCEIYCLLIYSYSQSLLS